MESLFTFLKGADADVALMMILKLCVDCGRPVDECKFQVGLRKFGWEKFADSISEEVTIPEWTTSNSSQKSLSP